MIFLNKPKLPVNNVICHFAILRKISRQFTAQFYSEHPYNRPGLYSYTVLGYKKDPG